MTTVSLAPFIGSISLNISFFIYLFIYLPQILHNRKASNIKSLSLCMHYVLYGAYLLDFFYGFARHLQWQYKTVSIIGLALITTQHLQIMHFWQYRYFQTMRVKAVSFIFHLFFLLCITVSIIWFFLLWPECFTDQSIFIIGTTSRLFFITYCLPQIVKNQAQRKASAISELFIYLSIVLSILDLISAWCLDWGWPNKLGSPITLFLMLTLLWQSKQFNKQG